jgi:hypothetical protein
MVAVPLEALLPIVIDPLKAPAVAGAKLIVRVAA